MADSFSFNEMAAVGNKTSLYGIWRLVRTMIAAGWTVAQSSDGSTFGASDKWTTYAGLTSSAWIVLTGPGSRQVCFWRGSASTTQTGKIIYSKSGGHTFASASASTPGTLPATAQYLRGDGSTFVNWMGTTDGWTNTVCYVHAAAKDVSDGSFYVIMSGSATQGAILHHLSFWSLTSVNTNDTDPYIWLMPISGTPTTNTSGDVNGAASTSSENAAGTTGYYWGWARNAAWKQFGFAILAVSTTAVSATADVDPYSVTTPAPAYLDPIQIVKTLEPDYRERKGWPKYLRRVGANCNVGDTFASMVWVVMGTNAAYFSDGTTTSLNM